MPAGAATLSDVLAGIDSVRRPNTLTAMTFAADLQLNLVAVEGGILPEEASCQAAWRAPGDWMVAWQTGTESLGPMGDMSGAHPAVDHLLIGRPDFLGILYRTWTIEYQGSAFWEGEPAWQLLVRPTDLTVETPSFNLYVRKDDFVVLRASVEFPDGTRAITDLTWVTIDNVSAPARFTTVFTPALGPLAGFETTFHNHQINPDLSGVDFPGEEGTIVPSNETGAEEGPPIFQELYHGFADEPVVANISDSSGTYDRVRFTFSLYVEDSTLVPQLNHNHDRIRDLAAQVVSGREWSGEAGLGSPGGKFQCGEDIRTAINDFLGTDKITDFYFLDFTPLEPGE